MKSRQNKNAIKPKIIKSILIPTLVMLSLGVVTPIVISSCGKTSIISVKSVLLNKKSLTLDLNESEQLTATVLPENATNKNLTWSSNNPKVATVDKNGLVTAVGIGEATITATTEDGNIQDRCQIDVISDLITINANSDSTLELINKNNNPNLQYSTDQENWNEYTNNIEIPKDTKLYLKGNNPNGWSFSYNNYSSLIFTGNVSVSGNVMGLLDNGAKSKEQSDITNIPCDYCFCNLFCKSNGVCEISNDFLPATNLTNNCYDSMFYNCKSLTEAPDLPAENLVNNCYSHMFYNCKSLTKTPDLPATELADYCYSFMFNGCSSLTKAPDLPAIKLANLCYTSMFDGCSSLTKAPDLPAIELANDCYDSMFSGCSSLTKTPDLPAIKLANLCYTSMFSGCSSLTKAPDLPTENLVNNCYSHMFYNCKSLTEAPDLPATELADSCYYSMFSGCSSLTKAPDLPATELANDCYAYMFYNCSSLTSIKIYYEGKYDSNYLSNWVSRVASNGIFYYNGTDSITNFSFPDTWTIANF